MSEDVRLLPPSGSDSYPLVHLSGHSLCIYRVSPADGKRGTPTPVRFRKQALEAGCNPVGMEVEEEALEAPEGKSDLILKAVEAVVDRNDPDEIGADARPTLKAVRAQAGFSVTRSELDAAWSSFEKSLD